MLLVQVTTACFKRQKEKKTHPSNMADDGPIYRAIYADLGPNAAGHGGSNEEEDDVYGATKAFDSASFPCLLTEQDTFF
jgi:hypothetical protein